MTRTIVARGPDCPEVPAAQGLEVYAFGQVPVGYTGVPTRNGAVLSAEWHLWTTTALGMDGAVPARRLAVESYRLPTVGLMTSHRSAKRIRP
ncbi:hypothetical protein [Mycolicibacterium sediminis]|uniref:Uncharacterized protein n=1 Tax=Mycolicibacterium sediminis TaxID=1286180 RepID=A0A7I7QM40_9MYCO|nr:hypothetical protein [Mycolicibacterium sediminis]BBY27371.1 hypothetical protein MSEDJ_14670 [Mycolicibacterium sediminis]